MSETKDEGYYGPMIDDYEKRIAELEAALAAAARTIQSLASNTEIAVAAEREACARVADDYKGEGIVVADIIAAAIRERGSK